MSANYYFNNALSGDWLVGLSAIFSDQSIAEVDASTRIITALFSYQTMCESFNLDLGASYFSLPKTTTAYSAQTCLRSIHTLSAEFYQPLNWPSDLDFKTLASRFRLALCTI